MELISDRHGANEFNLITAPVFYSMVSLAELLERLERAHELVTSLSLEFLRSGISGTE